MYLGTKMADMCDAILFSRFVLGQDLGLVLNQRQLVVACLLMSVCE